MRASTWTSKTITGFAAKFNSFGTFKDIAKAQQATSSLKAPQHAWPLGTRMKSSMATTRATPLGFSGPTVPINGSATRDMRILGAKPVNEGKQVDMEFSDGSAYRSTEAHVGRCHQVDHESSLV